MQDRKSPIFFLFELNCFLTNIASLKNALTKEIRARLEDNACCTTEEMEYLNKINHEDYDLAFLVNYPYLLKDNVNLETLTRPLQGFNKPLSVWILSKSVIAEYTRDH